MAFELECTGVGPFKATSSGGTPEGRGEASGGVSRGTSLGEDEKKHRGDGADRSVTRNRANAGFGRTLFHMKHAVGFPA